MNSKRILNIKYENLINKYADIDILPTFNKICLAQNLLKEMNSLKERFDDNKNKMINEIGQNCFKYYKKKITAKEIFDYFESNNLEEHIDYKLINNPEKLLDKDLYLSIFNFIFTLRNNYSFVMKIIKYCDFNNYNDICYIFVHLFYEDISTTSFFQEELFIFIYLILDKLINEKMPKKLNNSDFVNNDDFYFDFSYYLMSSLTKKADIRNYFCSFLKELLSKIEDYEDDLSPNLKIITKNLGVEFNEEKNNKKNKMKKSKTFVEQIEIKSNRRFKEIIKNSNNNIKKKIKENEMIQNKFQKEGNYFDFEVIDVNMSAYPIGESQKLDPFFERENTDMNFICEKLNFYESIKNKSVIDYAYVQYLEKFLKGITLDGEPVEIYSNIILRNELKITKINGDEEIHHKIINIYKLNYDFITSFINILLLKIKENIKSIPLTIKYIFSLIDELFKKKYSSENKNIYNYNILILKSRLFVGSMIIPMLSNINSSGILTDKITSELSKENINIIAEILRKAISGNLFLIEDNGFTLFNKYIINIIPQIFDIVINLNKDCTLPEFINKLIQEKKFESYDYFKEKKEENIQYQSICISFKEINILLNIIENNKDIFLTKNLDKNNKNIIESFLNTTKEVSEKFNNNISDKFINYYIFKKINYKPDFDHKIKAIIQDSFEIFFENQKNDIVVKFKKCLSVLLTYINHLQNEDFVSLIKRKEDMNLISNNQIKEYFKNKTYLLYENTTFDTALKIRKENKKIEVKTQKDLTLIKKGLKKIGEEQFKYLEKMGGFFMQRKSIIKSTISNIKEELDFESIIFPKITSKIFSELYPQKANSHRILFCNSFIQEHIKDLPIKYTQNNFKDIFNEIIQETIFMIKELQNNILNVFYAKIRNSEKVNLILNKDFQQIKDMERYSLTGYLFNKIILKGYFNVKIKKIGEKEEEIETIQLELNTKKPNNKNINIESIQSFIQKMPKFSYFGRKNIPNNNCDLLEIQKKFKVDEILHIYFDELKNIIKKEKIIKRFSQEEFLSISYELENYILSKLYPKLFPINETKEDIFFYNKICRLNFIKPENVIKDKKMINEKLLEFSINYIKEMDRKITPIDKINSFGKAIDILKNSMTFNSGKTDLGLDDTLSFIIYVIIKSKFKNIYTNLNYCTMYMNQELGKKHYGNLLTQLKMVINIIKNMKHNDLINVTKEQFGND